MEMHATRPAALPPIAMEAVLKLLAVKSARNEFAAALPAETPALRLEGAAQSPALPLWPGVGGRLEVPRGVPGRPARRAPGRDTGREPGRDQNRERRPLRRDPGLLLGE